MATSLEGADGACGCMLMFGRPAGILARVSLLREKCVLRALDYILGDALFGSSWDSLEEEFVCRVLRFFSDCSD